MPPETWQALRSQAKAAGRSMNQVILDMIAKGLPVSGPTSQPAPSNSQRLKEACLQFKENYGRLPTIQEAAKISHLSYTQVWNLKTRLDFQFLTQLELDKILELQKRREKFLNLPLNTATFFLALKCHVCGADTSVGLDNRRVLPGWLTKEGKTVCQNCQTPEDKADKEKWAARWRPGWILSETGR